MFLSKRAVLRMLASVLEATEQARTRPSRGYRHALAKEEHYNNHLHSTLAMVMFGMAQALNKNDREKAAKLLHSLAAKS